MQNHPVVLITGCSTGIGYETALLLAQRGFHVFATLRNLKKAGPLRRASHGLPLEILALDVDKPSSVLKAVSTAVKKAGRIDVLINNAGWGSFGAIEEFTDEEIREQYETNVFGLLRVTRAVLPIMRKQHSGRVVHIGSLAGKMTFAGIGLYCSAKHAVEAITESLRMEVKPFNIQVAVVEPGSIKTPFKANRRKAKVFSAGRSVYQKVLNQILCFGDNPSFLTPGPLRVAQVIAKAVQTPSMAIRYPVGWDAVWLLIARWFMPDSLFDQVLKARFNRFQRQAESGHFQSYQVAKLIGRVFQRSDRVNPSPVALITGANSGIGLACVEALSHQGFRVYGTYRKPRKAGSLWGLSRTLPVYPLLMDVNRTPSVQRAISQIIKREGKVDLLINNAGFVMAGFWEDLSEKDIREQFETNVFGLLRVSRAVLPFMRKQGSGKVINIGSVAGFLATPGLGPYSATKHAVNSLTEALRMETRPWGIEVTEINPGEIRTSIVQNARLGERVKYPGSPYRFFTESFEKFQEKRFQRAAPVEKVTQVVLKTLGHHPMKRRYLVKPEDRFLYYLRWLLPDALWEWGLGRMFPWSRVP